MKLLLILFSLLVFQLPSSQAHNNHEYNYNNEPDFQWLFTMPTCLPQCTEEDKKKLLQQSVVENKIIGVIQQAKKKLKFSLFTFSRKPILMALAEMANKGVEIEGIVDRGQWKVLTSFCQGEENRCQFPEPFNTQNFQNLNLEQKIKQAERNELYRKASVSEKLQLLFPGDQSPVQIRLAPGRGRLVHNKFLLVDERYLLSGSGNWSSTAISVNLENFVLYNSENPDRSHSAIVKSFHCNFDLIWQGNPQLISENTTSCQLKNTVYFTPGPSGEASILHKISESIRSTKKSIDISMHHLTHPAIFQELKAALERGVQVRILLDDDDCNHKDSEGIKTLKKLKAKIQYLYTNCQLFQLSHNKYGIFDQEVVINGTANWSQAGLVRNYETFLIYDQPNDTQLFNENFNLMWKHSRVKNICWTELRDVTCPRINR